MASNQSNMGVSILLLVQKAPGPQGSTIVSTILSDCNIAICIKHCFLKKQKLRENAHTATYVRHFFEKTKTAGKCRHGKKMFVSVVHVSVKRFVLATHLQQQPQQG